MAGANSGGDRTAARLRGRPRAASLTVDGDLYRAQGGELAGVPVGPLDFAAIELRVAGIDALLGYNSFKDHVVCFDGPRAKLTIAG